jgi:hypothetical protein
VLILFIFVLVDLVENADITDIKSSVVLITALNGLEVYISQLYLYEGLSLFIEVVPAHLS